MGYFSNQYFEGDKMRGMALSVFYASFFPPNSILNFLLEVALFDYNINAGKHQHQQGRDSFLCVVGFICLKLSVEI